MRYWIGVASLDHVKKGLKEGFCQVCHGKKNPLIRMSQDDWIIYYSPKMVYTENEPCQMFTAIGQVVDDRVYSFEMSKDFTPYRRDIHYHQSKPIPIRPLINQLTFIKDKNKWGYCFRYGHFEIPKEDFELIASQMLVENL